MLLLVNNKYKNVSINFYYNFSFFFARNFFIANFSQFHHFKKLKRLMRKFRKWSGNLKRMFSELSKLLEILDSLLNFKLSTLNSKTHSLLRIQKCWVVFIGHKMPWKINFQFRIKQQKKFNNEKKVIHVPIFNSCQWQICVIKKPEIMLC